MRFFFLHLAGLKQLLKSFETPIEPYYNTFSQTQDI